MRLARLSPPPSAFHRALSLSARLMPSQLRQLSLVSVSGSYTPRALLYALILVISELWTRNRLRMAVTLRCRWPNSAPLTTLVSLSASSRRRPSTCLPITLLSVARTVLKLPWTVSFRTSTALPLAITCRNATKSSKNLNKQQKEVWLMSVWLMLSLAETSSSRLVWLLNQLLKAQEPNSNLNASSKSIPGQAPNVATTPSWAWRWTPLAKLSRLRCPLLLVGSPPPLLKRNEEHVCDFKWRTLRDWGKGGLQRGKWGFESENS